MADVLVRNEGSIIMLTPDSDAGREWIDENLGLESWQWLGNSCAIEWRYAPDIISGMRNYGLDVIPEFANVTAEDKQWLSQLGITASKKKAAVPLIAPQREAPIQNPPASKLETGEALAMEEQQQSESQQQQEKHTVLPELPNALLHMADGEEKPRHTVEDAEREYAEYKAQHPEYQVEDDEDLKDEYRNLSSASEFLQKAWSESTKNAVARGYMAGALDALRWAGKITVQDYSSGYESYLYGDGTPNIQKEARGGWHRISQYTIESDDKRFTITLIDATRRSKWFMLKDTDTGKSYEDRTMTEAKKRAIRIRDSKADEFHHDDGSDRYSLAGEPEAAQMVATPNVFKNALLTPTIAHNWVIQNTKTGQFWSGKVLNGWTDFESAEKFSSKALGESSLPLYGTWVNLDTMGKK